MAVEVDLDVLRAEASAEKDCFVKYSFQVFGLAVVWLGLLVRFQPTSAALGVSAIFLAWLCSSTARLGIYKYASANRNLGYELMLGRSSLYRSNTLHRLVASIPWEIQMRAWRVVQATIFKSIYEASGKKSAYNFFFPRLERLRPHLANATEEGGPQSQRNQSRGSERDRKSSEPVSPPTYGELGADHGIVSEKRPLTAPAPLAQRLWFQPETLVAEKTRYYTGSYLRTMIRLLSLFAALGVMASGIAVLQLCVLFYQEEYSNLLDKAFSWRAGALLVAGSIVVAGSISILRRMRFVWNRQRMLESEILSIHSCGITWQIVSFAHLMALQDIGADDEFRVDSLQSYLYYLSSHAAEASENHIRIHKWFESAAKRIGDHASQRTHSPAAG